MLIPLGLALLTGACWSAIGIVFSQTADRGLHPALMNLLCFGSIAVLTSIGIEWSAVGDTTSATMVSMCISGVAMTGGMAALQSAMKRGGHGVAWAVAQSGLSWPFVTAVLAHGERPGLLPWIGLGCIVASLALLAERPSASDADVGQRWFPLALLAYILIGAQQSAFQWPSFTSETPDPAHVRLPVMFAVAALSALPLLLLRRKRATNDERRTRRTTIAMFALLACGASSIAQPALIHCSDLLAAVGAAAIAFPIAIATCILLFTAYSCLYRGERPHRRTYVGLVACVTGVVLMCL